jgi:hypothetical protein
MATINQSSGQGALFELVARGIKDNYFVKDTKDSIFPYDARYGSSLHHLAERRTTVPLTRTNFGGTFEVEIDTFGDILTECALEIDLPTWLPPLPIELNGQPTNPSVANGLYPITTADQAATSYGYVNGVGYFLFESIQFFQDQFLIQEWSGDQLYIKQQTEGSWNSSYLAQNNAGISLDGMDNRNIQLRATPNHLRIYLPLPGMQCPKDPGFPLIALPSQTFRIKGTLRKLENLVVCSDPTIYKPAPWNVPQFSIAYPTSAYTFAPKPLIDIGQPTILLSTVQHYINPEDQEEIRTKSIQIPFRKQFENRFTFGELDYIPLDKGGGAVATRYIDGRHPAERLLWFFRNQNAVDQNRLDYIQNDYFDRNPITATQPYTVPYGGYAYGIKLNIAGKEREDLHNPSLWNQMVPFTKHEKYSYVGSMMWSTGDNYGTVYPAPRVPEGTVNFTTADRPTMYIQLANITSNIILGQRKAEFRVYVESWNVYEIANGRGRILFAN